jgi:hypothetical protein
MKSSTAARLIRKSTIALTRQPLSMRNNIQCDNLQFFTLRNLEIKNIIIFTSLDTSQLSLLEFYMVHSKITPQVY